jgi:hypothetical protein
LADVFVDFEPLAFDGATEATVAGVPALIVTVQPQGQGFWWLCAYPFLV